MHWFMFHNMVRVMVDVVPVLGKTESDLGIHHTMHHDHRPWSCEVPMLPAAPSKIWWRKSIDQVRKQRSKEQNQFSLNFRQQFDSPHWQTGTVSEIMPCCIFPTNRKGSYEFSVYLCKYVPHFLQCIMGVWEGTVYFPGEKKKTRANNPNHV